MNRITDLLAAGSCGINVELIGEVVSVDQVLENVLRHGAAADVAVADEKYSNHSFVSPYFAPECPVLQGIPGICKMCVLDGILAK